MATQLIRPTDEGVRHIAETMREHDRREIWLAARETPLSSLQKGVKISDRIAMLVIDDEPCSIFGLVVNDILTGHGTPWLLSSESILNHKREFLLQSPVVLDEMLNMCETLVNYVHVENEFSIRWLNRIGFVLDDPSPYGACGAMFHKFHMRASDV